jgi:Protein kinase domain/Protein kinase C terminal domain
VEADWWSLGILIFDMLTGNPPWWHKQENILMKKILTDRLRFPKYLSGEACSLIKGLLNRNVEKRLGSRAMGGPTSIKHHPFFSGTNWVKLLSREIDPPFVPELMNSSDTRNFDSEYTEQSLAQTPSSPLSKSQNELFAGFSYTRSLSPEIRRP